MMGFWDVVGKVAGAAANEVKEAGQRAQVYKAEMGSHSDSELARIIKNDRGSSPMRAGAAMQELKSRGYDQEAIKDLVRNA
ncbi:hypothetical protein ACWIW6_08440 [Ursidibacter sp. B-7004-1]